MPSAYRQFRWSCIQKIIAGLAICIGGITLVFADLSFGALTVPGHPLFGAAIGAAGMLYALSAAFALRRRAKPSVLRT